ncbi:hypothetical protein D3C73_1453960 [compost metagenome]
MGRIFLLRTVYQIFPDFARLFESGCRNNIEQCFLPEFLLCPSQFDIETGVHPLKFQILIQNTDQIVGMFEKQAYIFVFNLFYTLLNERADFFDQ